MMIAFETDCCSLDLRHTRTESRDGTQRRKRKPFVVVRSTETKYTTKHEVFYAFFAVVNRLACSLQCRLSCHVLCSDKQLFRCIVAHAYSLVDLSLRLGSRLGSFVWCVVSQVCSSARSSGCFVGLFSLFGS